MRSIWVDFFRYRTLSTRSSDLRHRLESPISRAGDVQMGRKWHRSKAESEGFRLVKEWASEDINISRYGRFEFGIINLHFEGSNLWIWFKIVTIRWNSIQMSISITKFHDSDTKLESPISRDIDVLRRPFFYQSKALTLRFRLVKEWESEDINISRYERFELAPWNSNSIKFAMTIMENKIH